MNDEDGGNINSNKTGRKPLPFFLRVVLLPALIGALIMTAILYVPKAGWTTNDVTTSQNLDYPDLQDRRYDSSPLNTVRVIAATASTLPNWKVISKGEDTSVVRIEARAQLFLFTDDITVSVVPIGRNSDASKDSSLVTIRSRSQVGQGDLGANARHIRDLQSAMDDKLPRLE